MPRPTAPSVAAADLDAACTDLRRAGLSYRQIGAQLGISPANAHKRVTRTLDRTRREPGDALRTLELERLDRLQVEATEVLAARHVVIQAGKVVVDDDTGMPYADHGPTLAAIRALVQVQESRRRLLGLDAPVRVDAKVFTLDQVDARIDELTAQLAADNPDWAADQRREQELQERLRRFRLTWSTPRQAARDPARFVGDGLALLLEGLDLDDTQREAAALEVERLLWSRADR
jgi:hypothetical protein